MYYTYGLKKNPDIERERWGQQSNGFIKKYGKWGIIISF
jgi:hypothetical protein